jgi:hypothetical protein
MTDHGPEVGYLLGGALVLIGVIVLVLRRRIASSVDGSTLTVRPQAPDELRSNHVRKLLIVCTLLILGGTAMVLGAALT